MRKLAAVGLASLLAGIVLASVIQRPAPSATPSDRRDDARPQSDAERIAALEEAIVEERAARQLLEDELFRLIDEVDTLRAGGSVSEELADARTQAAIAEAEADRQRTLARRDRLENRAAQLVEAGFTEDRAATILRLESEMRMDALRAQFEANRNGTAIDWRTQVLEGDRRLREELGEPMYEQYLQATGRPTAVSINRVMELSPAEEVGLRQGDQIVRYNGQRVYNAQQLTALQLSDSVGDSVIVDIMRDGVPMQVSMPSGPLGIHPGRGRRR